MKTLLRLVGTPRGRAAAGEDREAPLPSAAQEGGRVTTLRRRPCSRIRPITGRPRPRRSPIASINHEPRLAEERADQVDATGSEARVTQVKEKTKWTNSRNQYNKNQ